jgi:hypothetical protein
VEIEVERVMGLALLDGWPFGMMRRFRLIVPF